MRIDCSFLSPLEVLIANSLTLFFYEKKTKRAQNKKYYFELNKIYYVYQPFKCRFRKINFLEHVFTLKPCNVDIIVDLKGNLVHIFGKIVISKLRSVLSYSQIIEPIFNENEYTIGCFTYY